MALFDKLFSLKRRLDSDNCDPKDQGRSCQINPEQVRLLLFKECDWRGRKLLFDSAAIEKVPASKHDEPTIKPDVVPCIVEVSDGFSYVYKGPEADANVLGEMIFGAVAMNYKNVSLKIHIMDEPRRLMCTKVFCVPASRRISRVVRKTSVRTDTCGSRNASMSTSASKPLNVPTVSEDGVALSFSMDRGDSGFCGDQSSYSSIGSTDYFTMFDEWDGNASQEDLYSFHSLPGRKLSTSSNSSWQRRTFQNTVTRFELGQSSNMLNVPTAATGSDSQIYSNSSTSGTSDSIASGSTLPLRKSKLGLALLITAADSDQMEVVRKCVEQSQQLQALVCRLRLAAVRAGASSAFVSTLHRAASAAAQWLSDLLYGPRLHAQWLGLATKNTRTSNKMADSLLADFCSVLAVGDTKTTNFFISTLLTHVLTYHLGWVSTVSPYDTSPHPAGTPPRPYNALWAQLSDLCGSIGFPPRAARTIISGEKNIQFINRLLSILTYFLRCGDVKRTEYRYKNCSFKEIKTTVLNGSSSRLKRMASCVNKVVNCDSLMSLDNTQSSLSSANALVPSDVSLKKNMSFADLKQKLSSPECSGSSGLKPTCPIRRNPTMMISSLKASSDSSLNSSVSEDSMPEQKVVFVLGDDEKLVGLKNKSTNGKCVKKSSKVHNEPVVLDTQDAEECDRKDCEVRNTESPSKCCGQTLQHSKPIKHSGFKFEFDKYPQIVTNYMKSKNLEILNRHYIGKPGNLKLDNFQFDPMVVPPIQEEKCDACIKCQMMECLLQTPTNASEMEYMNDMPRISEPQYAKETLVTSDERQHKEMSPKIFVRKRKENVVVVNLVKSCKSADNAHCVSNKEGVIAASVTSKTDEKLREGDLPLEMVDSNSTTHKTEAKMSPQITVPLNTEPQTNLSSLSKTTNDSENTQNILKNGIDSGIWENVKLRAADREITNETDITSLDRESLIKNKTMPKISTQIQPESQETTQVSTSLECVPLQKKSLKFTKSTKNLKSLLTVENSCSDFTSNEFREGNELDISNNEPKTALVTNQLESITSNTLLKTTLEEILPTTSLLPTMNLEKKSKAPISVDILNDQLDAITSNDKSNNSQHNLTNDSLTCTVEMSKPFLKPIVFKRPERRVREKESDRAIEVKNITEFPLPELCTEIKTGSQRSGFDESLLGGVTDHYVPDLILQGTIAKPCTWEPELRRDLDITAYLNKQLDSPPTQAVAIVGDTNTWEVKVVGRECGTSGMSSLVGAMLDVLPAMWNAKVPAHQCLLFLESKLREFCVLSKTLADMLMSTDFCDIASLTKSLNIDINDVPLLLAVATTHTPQVATRYGISYR